MGRNVASHFRIYRKITYHRTIQQHKRTKTMRYVVTLMILIFASTSVFADDSETNLLAKKIKTKLQKKVDNKFDGYQGYCDVMIEMEHKSKNAVIKRVTGSGKS